MKKKELKKAIEELAQKIVFMSEEIYNMEQYLIDMQINDAKKECTVTATKELQSEVAYQMTESIDKLIKPQKHTMKDVNVDDMSKEQLIEFLDKLKAIIDEKVAAGESRLPQQDEALPHSFKIYNNGELING